MQAPLSRIANRLGRNVMSNFVRKHSHGGVPGENLPFDINNRYKLTALFTVFIGSGLGAPFLITRHQLLKKA
ncbi:cytochrome c oxidase subunit 7C, mitochondrial-like [Zerene cesonia]|uniref:cytochrome c oxidase subunit 7C, mitochondrial-like n=1 Tax=Zerene cesonia TaxID=33412 RepID=UPI0018E4FDB7|nr:cytochrome c oxidase subunit 7C, mitochondrial-like [Zerene cesonia]